MKFRNETESYSRDVGFDMRISYDTSNRTQYVGLAYPGALTSETKWSIYKLAYDGTSGRVTSRSYADGTDDHTKEWDERSSYTYIT